MTMLEIRNLRKTFKEVEALKGVNLSVKPNEVYGFIGMNGAGKTTTISLILDFLKRDDGTILFKDEPVNPGDIVYKDKIGYVPDMPSFPAYLTPREFLELSIDFSVKPFTDRKKRVEKVLSFVKLDEVNRRIGGFSRGMKQRLSIAAALIHDPELLIMDEPTSALDPQGRKEVLTLIRELSKTMTIFYSTHILEDAEKVCDRIGLIHAGQVIMEGTKETILKDRATHRHVLKTGGSLQKTASVLKKMDGLEAYRENDDGFEVSLGSHTPFELFKTLHENGLEIKAFFGRSRSLEDVFMEVTQDEDPASL